MDFELHDLTTEQGRDAFIWSLEETLAALARAEQEERDAAIADLLDHEDKRQRGEWRRTGEVKGPAAGTARVILGKISTDPAHPVVDRQGDVLCPGLLRNPPGDRIPCSEWNHSYTRDLNAPAAGFGMVREEGGELRATVVFNDTPEGRHAAERTERDRPDWSWTLTEVESRPLTDTEIAAGALRAIVKVRIVEISPVDKGASIGSGTLAATCEACALAAGGKCSGTGPGLPPCHPSRQRWDREQERLAATCAQLDVEAAQRRETLVDELLARQDATEAREVALIAKLEAERDVVIARLFERAGEDAPTPPSSWDEDDALAPVGWPRWTM